MRLLNFLSILSIIILIFSTNILSSNIPKEIDEIIISYIDDNNIPGAEVLIYIKDELDYHKAFGKADIKTGENRVSGQQFRIASITKTFTALRILQLHDEGLIDLNDSIYLYFPDFPNSEKISIMHLLNMTSGITDFADKDFLEKWHNDPFMEFDDISAINMSRSKAETFIEPGEKVIYSNINYTLLGQIIKKVTNNSIQDEFKAHIFSVLNMTDTLYPVDKNLPGDLRGYSWNNSEEEFIDISDLNPTVPSAGGAVISNIPDLKKYIKALYNGDLLSKETHKLHMTFNEMDKAPKWIGYGSGLVNMGGFVGHNGTIFGFSSEMYYFPPKKASIIINVNRSDIDDKSWSSELFLILTRFLFPDHVHW